MSMKYILVMAVAATSVAGFSVQASAQDWVRGVVDANKRDQERLSDEVRTRHTIDTRESYAKAYIAASMITQCVVDDMGSEAGRLLGGPMTDDENFKRLAAALSKEQRACMKSDAVGIPMSIVNATLAERAVMVEPQELEPRAMSLNQDEVDEFTMMTPGVQINMEIIGRCAAAYSPGLSYAVLETVPGSDSEVDALNKLYRSTPECGLREAPEKVPVGYQRGVLANGLYHWLHRS